MARRFVVLGHAQKPALPLRLEDPAGEGRWDVLTRCVASAFLLSNNIRQDTEMFLVLTKADPPRTLWLKGASLQHLNPDERSTFGLLANALRTEPVAKHPMEATPGCWVANWGLEDVLAKAGGPVVWLHESGAPWDEAPAGLKDALFVLSDHREFTPAETAVLERAASKKQSLGRRSLQAASCITIVHHLLDNATAD